MVSSREQWLADRGKGLGASEAAVVLGISPFKTRYALWAEKCGLIEPDDLSKNEAVEFGCRLERPIAEAFAERTGRTVVMWPQFESVVDPERPWMRCTPDATQDDDSSGEGLVQIKTTSAFNASDWAEGPPLYYQVQCQHELAVTGHQWTSLVVLIGGQRLRYYDLKRNDRFIAALIENLEEFWQLVQSRTAPEVDGSQATSRALAKLHPEDSGETIELPADAQIWTEQLESIREEIKAQEARKAELENLIKASIGDATFGTLPDGRRWSWKTQKRAEYVAKASSFRVLKLTK